MIKVKHHLPILAAFMLLGILLFQGWQLTSLLREREWEYSDTLLHNLSGRAQTSLGRRFESGDMVAVRQAMSEIYLFKRETEAFLIGPGDRVVAADRLGFDGDPIAALPIKLDPAKLRQSKETLQVFIVTDRPNNRLIAYVPVSMSRAGQPPFSKAGVLAIILDAKQGIEEVSDVVRQSVLSSLVIVLLLIGTVTLALHFLWTRRVTAILNVTQSYLRGNLSARNTAAWKDEIGEIALAFNQISDAVAERQARLEASQQELQELNATLEARVAERTATLAREVEERSRIELALRASEQELQSVLDLAPDGIVVITQKGIITKFNEAAERMTGWSEKEVVGQNVKCLMPEPHRGQHDHYLMNYQETGIAKVIGSEREVHALRRDGSLYDVSLSVSAVTLRGEGHYIGIIRNISDRKAAEAALAKAQQNLLEAEKMAALGGLVAGVAHEINTPVGVGVTAISHLALQATAFSDRYRAGEMKRSDLEQFLTTCNEATAIIETNLERASQLIRSFKEIAVDQTGDDVREIVLGDYINQVLTSLRPKLKQRPITVSVDIDPADLRVRLQPGGLSQVVTNLVMNSLTHGFEPEAQGEIRLAASLVGDALELVYADTGKGMSAEIVERIFDPFFTTKRGAGGSGLGMHIVYNLLTQKYGGQIRCESAPGKGTRFIMHIPRSVVASAKETT